MGSVSGEKQLIINGSVVSLRLTLGGLAWIAEKLNCEGPQALSDIFRCLTAEQAKQILLACSDVEAAPSDADIIKAMPDIAELFQGAFNG